MRVCQLYKCRAIVKSKAAPKGQISIILVKKKAGSVALINWKICTKFMTCVSSKVALQIDTTIILVNRDVFVSFINWKI